MPERSVSIRLSTKDGELVRRALGALGADGEKALKRIEHAAIPASKGLRAVNAVAGQGKLALQGYASQGGAVTSMLAGMGPAGLAAAAGLVAIGAGGGALVYAAKKTAELGDQYDKMSLRTGVLAEDLSTLRFAAGRSGAQFETLEKGLQRMARNALEAKEGTGEAAREFTRLGIAVTDANGELRPTYDLMLDSADALKGLTSDSERAAVAQRLFGRSGADLLPLLGAGAEGIKGLQAEARALGIEFSTKAATDSALFQDRMLDLSSAFEGIRDTIGGAVLPALTSLVQGFTKGVVVVGGVVRFVIDRFDDLKRETGDLLSAIGAAFGDFGLRLWNINKGIATILWQPLIQAGKYAWDQIEYYGALAWNAVGEDAVAGINYLIDKFNVLGEYLGVTFDRIEFGALAVEAPATMAERWEEGAANVNAAVESIKTNSQGIATELKANLSRIGIEWDSGLGKMIQQALDAGEAAGEAYTQGAHLGLKKNEDVDLVIPARDTGGKTGKSFRQGLEGELAGSYEEILNGGDFLKALTDLGGGIKGLVLDALATDLAKDTIAKLAPIGTAFAAVGKTAADRLLAPIGGIFKDVFDPLADAVTSPLRKAIAVPPDVGKKAGSALGSDYTEGFRSQFTDAGSKVLDAVKPGDAATKAVGAAVGTPFGDGFLDSVKGKITGLFKPAYDVLKDEVFTPLTRGISSVLPPSFGEDIGFKLGKGIGSGATAFLAGKTLQALGLDIPDEVVIGVSLATAGLDLFGTGTQWGKDVGAAFKTGLATYIGGKTLQALGVDLPEKLVVGVSLVQSGLTYLAKDSKEWTEIKDNFGSALKAGAAAAGLASIFAPGSETGAAIGAAVGSLFFDSIGAAVGGSIGSIVDTLFFGQSSYGDKIKQDAAEQLQAALLHFGGLDQLISKAGGAANVGQFLSDRGLGKAAWAVVEKDFLRDALSNTLIASGRTFGEAQNIIDRIQSGGYNAAPPSSLDDLFVDSDTGAPPVAEPPPVVAKPVATPPPPAYQQPPASTFNDAERFLVTAAGQRTFSVSGIKAQGWGNLAAAIGSLNARGIVDLTSIGTLLKEIIAGDGSAGYRLSERGYQITAAQGFHGYVSGPTHILAGEAGRERVDIEPDRPGRGGMGGGGGDIHVHMHFGAGAFQALDGQSVREMVLRGELGRAVKELIDRAGYRKQLTVAASAITYR